MIFCTALPNRPITTESWIKSHDVFNFLGSIMPRRDWHDLISSNIVLWAELLLKVKLAQKCLKDIVAPFPFSTPPYYFTQPTGLLLCTDLYGTGTGRHKRVRSRAYYRPSFLFSVDFSLEALYLYLSSLGAKMLDHQYTKKSICIPTITILGTYVTLE